MGPVYATRLVIYSDATHPPEALFHRSVQICSEWLSMVARRYGVEVGVDCDKNFELWNDEIGSHFSAEHLRLDDAMAWRAIGVHPFENILRNRQMRFELQVRYSGAGEVVVTVRLLLGSTIDSIRPVTYKLRPPRLISNLIDAFPNLVASGNMRAIQEVTYPTDMELLTLCRQIIDPDRLVPVIVVSRDADERLAVPLEVIERIARDVAGLARVYVLPTFVSAYHLSDFFSKKLSCYWGAIRIYWPGFSLDDSPYQHPLYTAARIQDERLDRVLPQIIFSTIAAASANAIGADDETLRMYRSAAAYRQAEETAVLLTRLNETSSALERREHVLNETAEALLTEASTRIEELTKEKTEFRAELERLQLQLHQQQAYNDTLQYQITSVKDPTEVTNLLIRSLRCRSVLDVVSLVQELADEDYLIFLPEALESAEKHFYSGNIVQVLEKLFTIQRVARRYHLGDPLGHKELFAEEGEADYRANISDTARQRHRSDYERNYTKNGMTERILLGPHLRVGGGVPSTSVAVYWYVDPDHRRYVIGHIGRHLGGKKDT